MARGDESSMARANRARSGVLSSSDPAVQREVATYVDRQFGRFMADFATFREKLQVLLGERGTGKAVTKPDLAALSTIQALESKEVMAPPTSAEFNALVRDVKGLHARLDAIASKLYRS